MSVLLLDASVWLAALDRDDRHHQAARAIVQAAVGDVAGEGDAVMLAALDLTLYEVANIAIVNWRSHADAERLAELIMITCPQTLDRVDAERARDAATIAIEHGLTVYDAAYVAAARRRGWKLVSGDHNDLVRPGLAVAPDAVSPRGAT